MDRWGIKFRLASKHTGCPRKKSTIKCVCYLQVLFEVSRKTVCHKQGREGSCTPRPERLAEGNLEGSVYIVSNYSIC